MNTLFTDPIFFHAQLRLLLALAELPELADGAPQVARGAEKTRLQIRQRERRPREVPLSVKKMRTDSQTDGQTEDGHTDRSLNHSFSIRASVECWVNIFQLPRTTRISATSCLSGDQLPRKDAQCETVATEVDEIEEFSYGLVAVCVANLLVTIANGISYCLRRKSIEEIASARRVIYRKGKSHDETE